jgi:hypothetical protein
MKFNNEAEVLKALNIPNWDALTQDLLPQLAKMVPAMDKDLAAQILPRLSADSVQRTAELMKTALEFNDRNQDRLHEFDVATLNPLAAGYSQAATPEERDEHWHRIQEVRREKNAKDTENKEFWLNVVKVTMTVTAITLIATFVAARTTAHRA